MIKKILFIIMVLFFSQLSCMDTLNDAYDAKSDIPRSGLVGEWLFDSNNGTTTYDTSGSGNDGVYNTNIPVCNFPVITAGHNGVANSAYSFTTGSDSIVIDNTGDEELDVSNITVSFFIYPTGDGKIIMKDDEGSLPSSYQVEIGSSKIQFTLFTSLVNRINIGVLSTDVISMNRWYHVACTYDGSKMRIYIDSNLDKEVVWTGIIPQAPSMKTYIGKVKNDPYPTNTDSFKGTIDSVRIYNRALSEVEVAILANE